MDVIRGKIRNRDYARQIKDFTGLRFGNITPTDTDLTIEYKNVCYIFGELKYKDTELPRGQELAFERQCDDMSKVKPTIFIVSSHDVKDDGDIDVAKTLVRKYRYRGKWRTPSEGVTTRQLIDRFINWVEIENS